MSGTRAISTTSRRDLSPSFFFLQSKEPKEIHAILTEVLACFLPDRAKDLSVPLYIVCGIYIYIHTHAYTFTYIYIYIYIGKGKAVPLQAESGPEGSRKLRFPDFMTTAQDGGKVVSPTHRPPLPPGNAPGTYFCWRLSRPQGHSVIGRIMSMKNSNDTIWN